MVTVVGIPDTRLCGETKTFRREGNLCLHSCIPSLLLQRRVVGTFQLYMNHVQQGFSREPHNLTILVARSSAFTASYPSVARFCTLHVPSCY